jgi:RHS repeat-associated protein
LLSGPQPVNTSIGYVYNGSYEQTSRFGYNGNGTPISASVDRFQATLSQYGSTTIGNVGASYAGLDGWTLDVHHTLDPQTGALYRGDGKYQPGTSALTTFAGTGQRAYSGDGGPATSAGLAFAGREGDAIAVSPSGVVYFTDASNHVRKIDENGIITTVAGDGAARVELNQASGLALAPNGDLYISDALHCRIRRLDASSTLTTVAGAYLESPACVDRGTSGDGPADPAAPGAVTFSIVRKIAFGPDGTLYIAERDKLRRLRDGQVSTVASGFSQLCGVAVAPDGTLFVSDSSTGKIQRIASNGAVSAHAGGGASDADGIPATSAVLWNLEDVTVGPDGLVYFVEAGLHRVRRVNADGTIQTVAGTGVAGVGGDGRPTATALNRPGALAFGPDGSLFIIDSENSRVRKIATKAGISLGGGASGVASLDGRELYHFDAQGRHLRTLDTHTSAAVYTFGYTDGILTSITDVSGRVTNVIRAGDTTTITPPDGQPTTLHLDPDDNLERLTHPDGTFYDFGYDAGGLLTSMADPKATAEGGQGSVFEYADGLLVADTDARVGSVPQTLDRVLLSGATGWSVTHTTPNGHTSEYRTELGGGIRTRAITYPDDTQALELRREDGAPVFSAGGAGYDRVVTKPDGTQIWSRSQQNPAYGGKTDLTRDERIQLPSGLARVITQSAAASIDPATGALLTETITTTQNGRTTTVAFDAAARTYTTTSPLGRSILSVLDAAGHTARTSVEGIGNPNDFQYDTAGRLFKIIQGNRVTQLDYFSAASGLKSGYLETAQTYASGAPPIALTNFDRDALGRILQTTTGGATTGMTWDPNGNLSTVTPPGKPTHTLDYDAINLLATYTPPPAGLPAFATSYTHDADRMLRTETRPDGVSIVRTPDSAGRLDTVQIPGGLVDYDYVPSDAPSGAGKTSDMRGPYGVDLAFTYDGSLTTSTNWSGDVAGAVAWQYNEDFQKILETVSGTTGTGSTSFGYDNDQLLTCASPTSCTPPSADSLILTRYPGHGMVTGLALGSTSEAWIYNDFGELARQTVSFDSSPLVDVTYDAPGFERDALGRIARKTETIVGVTKTYDYRYDALRQVDQVKVNGVVDEEFTYDGNGNRLTAFKAGAGTLSAMYDEQDRLLTYGTWTFTYTANGELETKTNAATSQTWLFQHDVLGNLLSVGLPNGDLVEYLVDGMGRRVGKMKNGVLLKQWVYRDALKPVAELDGAGALVAQFAYGSKSNVPDYVRRGTDTYRVVSDHLGSPRYVVNVSNSSDVPFTASYSSFGEVAGTGLDWMPFGFAGGLYDPDTQIVRFGVRDVDPQFGRWLRKEPLRFRGNQNFYVYARNNPLAYVDPTGLQSVPEAAQCMFSTMTCFGTCANLITRPECGNCLADVARDCAPSAPDKFPNPMDLWPYWYAPPEMVDTSPDPETMCPTPSPCDPTNSSCL